MRYESQPRSTPVIPFPTCTKRIRNSRNQTQTTHVQKETMMKNPIFLSVRKGDVKEKMGNGIQFRYGELTERPLIDDGVRYGVKGRRVKRRDPK
ncbi:hypothetical protein E3N88_30826 [Mikania micrantha]|uniref:Uncharacterized protein n=1 Tax=Mikania micrantha TaxID=192012 RepID=A0A5N6MNH8_9ASTR|nr:hypothetical protein E3N88_30826 [Mikania micrantha]